MITAKWGSNIEGEQNVGHRTYVWWRIFTL